MYIENEIIVGDGVATEFTLNNAMKAGTALILFNNEVFYEFNEVQNEPTKIQFDFAPSANNSINISYYTSDSRAVGNASRYCSTTQVRKLSLVDYTSENDDSIESYIREAEGLIDTIIGNWEKYDDTQMLTFPRKNDKVVDYAVIPSDITRACVYAVDNIYLAGVQTSADNGGTITSEKMGDYSYTKSGGIDGSTPLDFARQQIGAKALGMISKYIRKFGSSVVTVDEPEKNVNSRQKWVIKNS